MSKHMKLKIPEGSKEYNQFLKNVCKFLKIGYSGTIPFVYAGKVYAMSSLCDCLHGQDSKSKIKKSNRHIAGAYVNIHTKYGQGGHVQV